MLTLSAYLEYTVAMYTVSLGCSFLHSLNVFFSPETLSCAHQHTFLGFQLNDVLKAYLQKRILIIFCLFCVQIQE